MKALINVTVAKLIVLISLCVTPVLAFGIGLSDVERSWLKETPEVLISVDYAWPPFDFVDEKGEHQGLASDYLKEVSNALGIQFTINPEPSWAKTYDDFLAGKTQMVSLVVPTTKRDKEMLYSDKITSMMSMIITRVDYPYVEDISNLKQKRIAVVNNYFYHDFFRNKPEFKLVTTSSVEESLQLVVDRKADATIVNLFFASQLLHESYGSDLKISAPFKDANFLLHFGFSPDNKILQTLFNRALQEISPERHQQIHQKWLSYKTPDEIFMDELMSKLVYWFPLLCSLLIVFAFWQFKSRAVRNRLIEKAKAKSEFIAYISHEMRTPLNGILGMLELLMLSKIDAESKKKVSIAKMSTHGLLEVINDYLLFSKTEAGALVVEPKWVSLDGFLNNVISSLETSILEKEGLYLTLCMDTFTENSVFIDENRLRQILINFLSNSIKFTDSGLIQLSVTSTVVEDSILELCFEVRDCGRGMDEQQLNRIFQPYVQAENTEEGTGLGLAICGKIADSMGGSIEIHSEQTKGTVISYRQQCEIKPNLLNSGNEWLKESVFGCDVESPQLRESLELMLTNAGALLAADNERADITISCVAAGENVQRGGGLLVTDNNKNSSKAYSSRIISIERLCDFRHENTVEAAPFSIGDDAISQDFYFLIAEDNAVNQAVLAMQMKKLGVKFDMAANGEEAFELFKKNDYSHVFTDYAMPIMDGLALAKNIRAYEHDCNRARVMIVAITANTFNDEVEKCIASGMDKVLHKPLKLSELIGTIQGE